MVLLGSSWGPPGGSSCVVMAQMGGFQKTMESRRTINDCGVCDLGVFYPYISLLGGLHAA
jgi:hypothetical protein